MKKLLIATLIVVAAGSSAFAKDGSTDANKVNYKVKNSFEAKFYGAEKVSWTSTADYAKASFVIAGQTVDAYYQYTGEFIGLSRKTSFDKLPLSAIQRIKKDYASSKIADCIEFEQEGERRYYVSLDSGSKKQILEVSTYGDVSVFKAEKK